MINKIIPMFLYCGVCTCIYVCINIIYTWYMYVLHMNMPERLRNTGGQNVQILKLLNVMVTTFCIDGGGGGGGGGGGK